jgi:hypothetical protein
MKLQSNNTGTFTKQDSVSFDPSLWAATNGIIDWSDYPDYAPYSEVDVFHTQLTHTPAGAGDIGWTVRIGKGGQMYYIDIDGVGQITPPQRVFSAWNDDCMTNHVWGGPGNTDPEMIATGSVFPRGSDTYEWTFIHGSGMYSKPHMDPINNKPFYNPLLVDGFNPNDRSYTVVNFGVVTKPNINRSDVLFYHRYRDIGNGVLEMTYYCYNFGQRTFELAQTPWWPVRPSVFPNRVHGIKGTSSFINATNLNTGSSIANNVGWLAHTVNANDPDSITSAFVLGSNFKAGGITFGVVREGDRDMALTAALKFRIGLTPGTGVRYRRYAVFGKLKNVADICAKLDSYPFFEKKEFSTNYSGKMPLYATTRNLQNILTTNPTGSPIAYTYPIPVKDSLPLLLMKNNDTGNYFLSTDPCAACGKKPFTNPYPLGHAKYNTYQNRHVYQIYDGKTTWVELLGFVLPLDNSRLSSGFQKLSDVLTNINFIAGEKLSANQLMIYV